MIAAGHQLITRLECECRTLAEGMELAEMLAAACPRPEAQFLGLVELIRNAIEHGNLEIDFAAKGALLRSGRLAEEIDIRAELPSFRSRRVRVVFERTVDDVTITITDGGRGFDYETRLNQRLGEITGVNGRGIAIAQTMCFDSIEYRRGGSEVRVRAKLHPAHPVEPTASSRQISLRAGSATSAHVGVAQQATALSRKRSLILVADDEPVTRALLSGALGSSYDVEHAVDGLDAMDKYHTLKPDLMLIDVGMPRASGCDVCERVRATETDQRTPILLMSSQDDEGSVLDGLARGADDFIVKPFNQRVLLSKIHAQLVGKHTRDALAVQRERLLELQRVTAHEHFVAQAVLKNILGRAELDHPSIRCVMTAMSGFEGDVALVAKLPSGGLRVMVSDVVGHGLPAALGTIPLSLLFYSTTRQGIELGRAMKEINRELCGVLPVGLFAASAVFEVTPDGSTLRVWNGGIPDVILRRRDSRELVRFVSQNMPIGIVADQESIVDETATEAGDVVFAMSDGVIETRNSDGRLFGSERVRALLGSEAPVAGLFDALSRELAAFGQGRQDDDITLLAFTIGA